MDETYPVHNRSSDLTEKQFWLNLQTKQAFFTSEKLIDLIVIFFLFIQFQFMDVIRIAS